MKPFYFLALLAAPVWAEACPPSPDHSVALTALIDQIRAAPDERAAQPISGQMWELWLDAPDAAAQEVLDMGMRQRNNYDFVGSLVSFDRLVEYCPDYAEGYNQRAFTRFLRENYTAALVDLDAALALSPDHVGAQSGRALTLMNLGRVDEARVQMEEALKNNPWLSERALLAKGAPLGPKGEDI
ncbi:tetratricopeptide repeat protein [uncultured Tateyamaria sp.]|uniref:tetratricopeptide repeat protein n=1 Tax=uncultured Tateyamaria sp. TaxID=455651 RepID=UPI00262DEB7A|nr:tetratricopeptide repeat protein [uncultured Tateyamaria sp.]